MITRVQIENYRCLKSVDVPLKPLSVLIGKNNTGKTAFLSALAEQRLAGRQDEDVPESDYWRGEKESPPQIIFHRLDSNAQTLKPALDPFGVISWETTPKNAVVDSVSFYQRDALNPAMRSKGLDDTLGIPTIDDQVKRLPAYLDALLRRDRQRFFRTVDTLKELVPSITDVHIATPKADERRIDFEFAGGYVMEGEHASYGVRMLLFFVALANDPSPPDLVLVDEPENGLHPLLLQEAVGLLRGLTTQKYSESSTQVVMTTHSPYMLDYIDIESDQVLVAQSEEDGSASISPVDRERIRPFLEEEFMLGEVWLNRWEEGLLSK